MAVLRIPTYFLWILIAVIIILAVALFFVKLHKSTAVNVNSIPLSIQYALEYFNAAESNSTLLVPSQYYSAAKGLSINNNRVIQNNSLYYSVLFNNATLPEGYYVLMDMGNISSLPDITTFSYNFTVRNLSSSLQNCEIASSKTDAFAVCSIYSNVSVPVLNNTVTKKINLGVGTFAVFPGNSTLVELNSTIVYNGKNSTYLRSIRLNNTAFFGGSMFLYDNITAFYLSPRALQTFYGREMFFPNSTLKNVLDNFYSVRIVR